MSFRALTVTFNIQASILSNKDCLFGRFWNIIALYPSWLYQATKWNSLKIKYRVLLARMAHRAEDSKIRLYGSDCRKKFYPSYTFHSSWMRVNVPSYYTEPYKFKCLLYKAKYETLVAFKGNYTCYYVYHGYKCTCDCVWLCSHIICLYINIHI